MPQLFRMGKYRIYFWSNEGDPLEPIHFHISEGKPSKNATKVWLLKNGKCRIENNNSRIPDKTLNNIIKFMEGVSDVVEDRWKEHFGDIFYVD